MLVVDTLVAGYSGIQAVRGVSLEVGATEIVALIGANGVGKTTLMNAISGVLRPTSGQVTFAGENLAGRAAHRIARRGLLQVPEGRRILSPLSVRENLELGRLARGGRSGADLDPVFALFPRLVERQHQIAGSLSGGEQQMLAIGRALMGRPRLLMLDEPSLGLAPIMVSQVFDALAQLNRSGLPILLVEQNARRALNLASRAYVLERGRIVRHGSAGELASDPAIQSSYLGIVERTLETAEAPTPGCDLS
jgi:branched-chain amino acid transport system ATP-binding protein